MKTTVKKEKNKYAQCNLCQSRENIFEIKNEKSMLVISLCKKCIKVITKTVKILK